MAQTVSSSVSIPSRGSGKGDLQAEMEANKDQLRFQSPLGEVVKETGQSKVNTNGNVRFQSPLGEVVKETYRGHRPRSH